MGVMVGFLSVVTGFWFWEGGSGSNAWQTMVFTMLTFCQMAYALCVRKRYQSLFAHSWVSNPVMLLAVGLTLALQLILIYTPFFNTVFRTVPLRAEELGICFAGAAVIIVITEIEKLILRREASSQIS
jgi:Ca2+-transporting ATPase